MSDIEQSGYSSLPWRKYTLVIENPVGSERSGTKADGSEWRTRFSNRYGYIVSTMGADNDELDCFLALCEDLPDDKHVYVIDQQIDGAFDEHKIMLGFDTGDQAAAAYKSNYEDGWDGFASVTAMTVDEFEEWASKPQSTPASQYALVGSSAKVEETLPTGTQAEEPKTMNDAELWDTFNEHIAKHGRATFTDSSEYAFPKDKGWPLDPEHIEAAYKFYNADAGEDKHSSEEWAHLGSEIISHLESAGKGKFHMVNGKIEHLGENEGKTKDADTSDHKVADSIANGMCDAMLLGPQSYALTDSKIAGRKTLTMVATFADKVNLNRRIYTKAFLKPMADRANKYANGELRYGEEPHPVWDSARFDYVTHCENEIWSMAQPNPWMIDSNGTLICKVDIDPDSPKGQAVQRKAARKENIPVSIRWGQVPNRPSYFAIVDGQEVEVFDERMIPYVYPQVVDKVSNPAVVGAGRITDSADGLPPMLDATNYQLQLSDAALETSGATTPNGAGSSTEEIKLDKAKIKELRKRIGSIADSTKKDKQLTALAPIEDADNGWSDDKRLDRFEVISDSVTEILDMQADKERLEAERKKLEDARIEKEAVNDLVKAIADGDGSGVLDMNRFTDEEDRQFIASRAQFSNTLADAKQRLMDAAADVDVQKRNAKLFANQTEIAVKHALEGVQGHLSDAISQTRTAVIVGATDDDKIISSQEKAILDCYFAIDQGRGIQRKPKLEKYNEANWVSPMHKRMGYDKPEARKGMADSIRLSSMSHEEKLKHLDLVPGIVRSLRSMNDSQGMGWDFSLRDVQGNVLTDTATTYTASNSTVLNQAWYAPTILKRIYWPMTSLPYMGGFLPGDMVPNTIKIGQVVRFMTVLRQEPINWYANDFNSLIVPEGAPPLPIILNNNYQDWGITPRGLSMTLTKDNILEMMAGPFHLDMFALSSYNVMDSMSLNNDLQNYLEITTAAAEEYAVGITGETVSSGNIVVSNICDNITYLATNYANSRNQTTIQAVNAIASINPSTYSAPANAPGVIFESRPDSWGDTVSTTPALFLPIVQPRLDQSMARTGVITDSYSNPITVHVGGVLQVQGYFDPFTLGIGSYSGTVAAYAVDYANGKILFTAAADVTTESTILLSYSYDNGVQFFQADGNPAGVTISDWTNGAFTQLRGIAQAGQKVNYIWPGVCLTGNELSAYLQSASIYYALFSPKGVEQDGMGIEDEWGVNMGQMFHRTVAPVPSFYNCAYNFAPKYSRYALQTPLTMTGPHQLYDLNGTGLPIESSAFMGREFSLRYTPLAVDANGVPTNLPYAQKLRFYAASGFNYANSGNVSN